MGQDDVKTSRDTDVSESHRH